MAGTFPNLGSGKPVRAGYTHSLLIRCDVKRFRSGKEQRFALSGLLNSFKLPYQNLKWADVVLLRDFFITQKGAYDSSWSITLRDPVTLADRSYADMAFDADTFEYTETSCGRYSVSLACSQTVGEAVTVNTAATFPLLSTGARVQLPNKATLKYSTIRNDLDCGKRWAYYSWVNPLRVLPLEYGNITDAEVQSFVGHYLAMGGQVNPFSFTDPDSGVVYAACRYSADPITITRASKNNNRLTVRIEEYAA